MGLSGFILLEDAIVSVDILKTTKIQCDWCEWDWFERCWNGASRFSCCVSEVER